MRKKSLVIATNDQEIIDISDILIDLKFKTKTTSCKTKKMNEKSIQILIQSIKKQQIYFFITFSAFTIIVIVWSFIFQIDIVSNAEGQVIPVGEVKTIQHLEGGIIEKILVKESEYVETGQPLVVLAATASEVDVEELQVRMDTQIIKSIRLEAEINNFEVPIFPDSLSKKGKNNK